MWRTAKLSSSLFETVVWIYVLNEKSQIPYGSYHAELAKWRAKLLFFQEAALILWNIIILDILVRKLRLKRFGFLFLKKTWMNQMTCIILYRKKN